MKLEENNFKYFPETVFEATRQLGVAMMLLDRSTSEFRGEIRIYSREAFKSMPFYLREKIVRDLTDLVKPGMDFEIQSSPSFWKMFENLVLDIEDNPIQIRIMDCTGDVDQVITEFEFSEENEARVEGEYKAHVLSLTPGFLPLEPEEFKHLIEDYPVREVYLHDGVVEITLKEETIDEHSSIALVKEEEMGGTGIFKSDRPTLHIESFVHMKDYDCVVQLFAPDTTEEGYDGYEFQINSAEDWKKLYSGLKHLDATPRN